MEFHLLAFAPLAALAGTALMVAVLSLAVGKPAPKAQGAEIRQVAEARRSAEIITFTPRPRRGPVAKQGVAF